MYYAFIAFRAKYTKAKCRKTNTIEEYGQGDRSHKYRYVMPSVTKRPLFILLVFTNIFNACAQRVFVGKNYAQTNHDTQTK